ncbi:hypothetical protein T01_10409 [Trichinella spiralis]|uniref:Uncharacterized protein n=1 Tax=Trichinella spiralis TaxID=6334 RepID=A0A0V1BZ08_TRISP|nr:hypothetical protein T01_10409 [Trichinella spiralis]
MKYLRNSIQICSDNSCEQPLMLRQWPVGMDVSGDSSSRNTDQEKQNVLDRDLLINFTTLKSMQELDSR